MTLLVLDRVLLDSFRNGESWAIRRVYQAYVKQIAELLRNGFSFMSGGQAFQFRGYKDAWDLECAVQDTFIQAFSPEARQAYDGLKPFGPYLMAIARNRVISLLRSESREQRRRTLLSAEPLQDPPESPEQRLMRRQLAEILLEFRESLEPELRRFLEVRFGEELSLMEAARTLGLTRMKARIVEQKIRKRFLDFLRHKGHLGTGSRGMWKSWLGLLALVRA